MQSWAFNSRIAAALPVRRCPAAAMLRAETGYSAGVGSTHTLRADGLTLAAAIRVR